jgi:transposase InsO family protein
MPWKEVSVESQRLELVNMVECGRHSVAQAAAAAGVSRRTGYKWLARHRNGGLPALADRSRRPRTCPSALSGELVLRIAELRNQHPSWGPKKLQSLLERERSDPPPSVSSISRALVRLKLVNAKGRGRRRRPPLPPRVAIEADAPNAVWSVDLKGWWLSRDRRKVVPLTVQDVHSRMVLLACPLERLDTDEVRRWFETLFRRFGLPGAIRCDNGPPFASLSGPLGLTRLSAWWRRLGIKLDRIDPGHPEQNGIHERMHREIASAGRWSRLTWAEAVERLEAWRAEYNVERPHEALGMRRPAEVYRRRRRQWDGVVPVWGYPDAWKVRTVKQSGELRSLGFSVFVSEALGSHRVGLEPVLLGGAIGACWRLWFCDLELGVLRRSGRKWQLDVGYRLAASGADSSGPPRRPTASAEARTHPKVLPMS